MSFPKIHLRNIRYAKTPIDGRCSLLGLCYVAIYCSRRNCQRFLLLSTSYCELYSRYYTYTLYDQIASLRSIPSSSNAIMYCVFGFAIGKWRKTTILAGLEPSPSSPRSSEKLPRYTSLAPVTQNWLQKTFDYIQDYSSLRHRVRGVGHTRSFLYARIPSENNSTLGNENFHPTHN